MIRSPAPDDLRFVRSAWLQSHSTSDFAKLCTPPPYWAENGHGGRAYFDGQRLLIERLIASSVVLVAEGEADLDGFAVGWPGAILHYVYVRQTRRARGVARALLDALDLRPGRNVRYTHRSAGVRGSPRGWTFDPSPTTMIGETMADKLRVKYFHLRDSISARGGANGEMSQRTHLDAERDRSRVWLHLDSALMEIEDIDRDNKPVTHWQSMSNARDVLTYPKGEEPEWEKELRRAKPKSAA